MRCARWSAFAAALLVACGGAEFSDTTDAGTAPDSSLSTSAGGTLTATTGAAGSSTTGAAGSMGAGGDGSGGASTGGTAGVGGTSGTGGAAGAGGIPADGGACSPACMLGLICCSGKCINPNNDILNCGRCGNQCAGAAPYCNGMCGAPPCTGVCDAIGTCCFDQCCAQGKLCCVVPGPGPSMGPKCTDPMGGSCPPGCPACRCNSPDTPIATPEGSKPIASLRDGDLVYSLSAGRVVAVPIRVTSRVAARDHSVVRLKMEGGVVLEISAPHPTADGRTIGALRPGDALDGVRVVSTTVVRYEHEFTYDILPDSDSGAYFAGGVLIGSTLGGAPAESLRGSAPLSGTTTR